MSNTPMEDFIPGLNSAIDTIERQPVSNFVGKTIILEKVAKILKKSGMSWPPTSNKKILEDHPRLFWSFIDMLYALKILIMVVPPISHHMVPLISYKYLLVKI